jgi:hypothetical protein
MSAYEFTHARIGRKIIRRTGHHLVGPTHAHWCPACEAMHDFAVEQPFRNGALWSFNGDGDAPTFSPSMNIAVGPFPDGSIKRCHYILTAGRIAYCGDSTHALSGQTVDLPDIPDLVFQRSVSIEVPL